MLKYLPVSRSTHESERTKLLELVEQWKQHTKAAKDARDAAAISYEESLSIAIKQRDEAKKYASEVEEECDSAIKKYNAASDIATRALVLLQEVDTTRTGGKQLRALIDSLCTEAKEQGLWGESKE